MDVNSILNDFGRNINDDNVLDEVYRLCSHYNLDIKQISELLIAFLLSKNIGDENITLETIHQFEKDKMRTLSSVAPKYINKSSTIKNKINEFTLDILNQYQNEDSIPLDDSSKTEQNFVRELSAYEMDESSEDMDVDVLWPVTMLSDDDNYKNMYQQNSAILNVYERHASELFQETLEKLKDTTNDVSTPTDLLDLSTVDVTDKEIYTCGTIVADHSRNPRECDTDPTQHAHPALSPDNIAIMGLSAMKQAIVPINLTHSPPYSFFPGQHDILKGHGSARTGFVISKILQKCTKSPLPISHDAVVGDLRVLIAAGPFSMKDSDDIVLLEQIIRKLKEERSNVLILIGPFINEENTAVQARSEHELYSTMLTDRLLTIAKECIALNVHVVFVPSPSDAGHRNIIFPQPRFQMPADIKEFRHHLVHFVPNPGFFNIGPYYFGVTSVDILRHLKLQEIEKNHTKGINRLCQHILDENNFYPLIPANPEVSMDSLMWPHCHFGPNPPHCLIMPSQRDTFAEAVGGVYFVNPGYVVTNDYLGKYATLTLSYKLIEENATSIVQGAVCKFIRL